MVWYRYFGLSFIVLPLSYIINKFSYSISILKCTWCKVCQAFKFKYFLVKFTRLWNWRWPHYLSWKVFRKLFLKIETLTLVWIKLPLRLFFYFFQQHCVGGKERGFKDGTFTQCRFDSPQGVVMKENVIYLADTENHAIRKVSLKSRIFTH